MPRLVTYRAAFAIGTAYGLFAALVLYIFTLQTGRSLWTLDRIPPRTGGYILAINLILWNGWALLVPSIVALANRMPDRRAEVETRLCWGTWPPESPSTGTRVHRRARGWHAARAADGRALASARGAGLPADVGLADGGLLGGGRVEPRGPYLRDAQARAIRAAQLETRLVEARLEALQRQLQPHFLFNTLHAVDALIVEDTAPPARWWRS